MREQIDANPQLKFYSNPPQKRIKCVSKRLPYAPDDASLTPRRRIEYANQDFIHDLNIYGTN